MTTACLICRRKTDFCSNFKKGDVVNALIIIPARFASSRFPGKPLTPIKGSDGSVRPLIEWTWRQAVNAIASEKVIIATDDQRIADVVRGFGGQYVMTDTSPQNGTERCAAVLATLDHPPDYIVNLQGDAPLVPTPMIGKLIEFAQSRSSSMATPYVQCDAAMAARLREQARQGRVGGTTVVANAKGQALYFSKHPVPYGDHAPLKMHIGLYVYTPDALRAYMDLPPSPAEEAEGLEQLRFLDAGITVDVMETLLPKGGLWELNQPEDVPIIESMMAGG
jgi:3-deoxy-manno-octulosonate cytidylyltransferase (CMP-KDO synthetase)